MPGTSVESMTDIKAALRGKIPDDLIVAVPRSFDVIGSRDRALAILELPSALASYEKMIGVALMEVQKNVQTVLAKSSERHDVYRIRDLRIIAGQPNTEILHKEEGMLLKLDPTKVYFSPRESTERMRIAQMVKPRESVLVMFGGVCPFSIAIARKQPDIRVLSIEINPQAHAYCVQNILLNKVHDKVTAVLGDVREVCPSLKEKFDRVIMPLPKKGADFLDIAIPCLVEHGVLHFYNWASEANLFLEAERLIMDAAQRNKRTARIMGRTKVLPYGPRTWKVRVDAEMAT